MLLLLLFLLWLSTDRVDPDKVELAVLLGIGVARMHRGVDDWACETRRPIGIDPDKGELGLVIVVVMGIMFFVRGGNRPHRSG